MIKNNFHRLKHKIKKSVILQILPKCYKLLNILMKNYLNRTIKFVID